MPAPVDLPADPASLEAEPAAGSASPHRTGAGGFQLHLDNFEGPFDLLLSLISKHRLDVTLVALAQVTDEFLGYIRSYDGGDPDNSWDLDTASEFLVVAATLLDLKVARLLPSVDVDEEDLALLEARDLLFARLLQYRAYKDVVDVFVDRISDAGRRFPRSVGLEERFIGLLPAAQLGVDPAEFAALAARAMEPKPPPVIDIGHLHAPVVSVREQAAILAERLRKSGSATFRALVADCPDTMHVVGRFLAVLELYREALVSFDQVAPLGELHVRWTGTDEAQIGADLDDSYGAVSEDEHVDA